ncbi:hypothetical protein COU95_03565, partial [Candidatus Shapirobacteria bacterium CG10_big_fil_rev_8_21_14_0_10_40_9]
SSLLARLLGKEKPLIFEIATYNQIIHFYAVLPVEYQTYFESQLSAQYPKATILASPDYLPSWLTDSQALVSGQLKLISPFYFPLKTYLDFKETDPLSSILGTLARAEKEEKVLVQIVLLPAGKGWQRVGSSVLRKGVTLPDGKISSHPQEKLIEQKISQPGFRVAIRLLVCSPTKAASVSLLRHLAGSFGGVALGEGNAFSLSKPSFWQEKKFEKSIFQRLPAFVPKNQILNTQELATIYHLPSITLSGIKNIAWGTKLTGEPPDNLPIAIGATEEEKQKINFFARTEFKNKLVTFGINKEDRRRHIYIIGKTGTGKTTLIANMAINDMRNREGLAVVDPHGDLSEILLDFIPSHRLNDVCYLDPSDRAHPFYLNPLEVKDPEHRELVASGIVAIFYKLYSYSWGPRLEYILRNSILTLLSKPDSTLVEVPELLTNRNFRQKVIEKIDDRVLQKFWAQEFEQMSERLMAEAISPILNKVGQFVSSPMIRGIIGHPRSTVDLEEIMNQGKILIVNLSQGKLGEDNAALLGAMFITKMQLASMGRVKIPEAERKDFYLYVDEFQNFATTSFIKILSEARKYRLNLALANQYIAQVPEEVQKAIFGNTGTLLSFLVGAEDSQILSREFGGVYKEEELVGLGNYQIICKLAIENLTSRPFYAFTLPLPRSKNQNRDKVLRLSQERYTKPFEKEAPFVQPKFQPKAIFERK